MLVLNLLLALIFVFYCMINLETSLFMETIYTIPSGVVIFAFIDMFVYIVEFLAR